MRTIKLIFIMPCFLFFYTGCKKDNYTPPDSGIYGALTDGGDNNGAYAGDSLQLRIPGGGDVRLVEWNPKYPSPAPIDLTVKANGAYSATQIFADTYKVFPMKAAGPYLYLPGDSVIVVLNHHAMTQLNFKVVPFYRIKASVADSTFTYTVTKSDANSGNLNQLIFMISKDPVVNESVCGNQVGSYYTNIWKLNTSDAILGVQQTYTIPFVTTNLSKGTYYFRVGAVGSASSSYFNYSPTIQATVH